MCTSQPQCKSMTLHCTCTHYTGNSVMALSQSNCSITEGQQYFDIRVGADYSSMIMIMIMITPSFFQMITIMITCKINDFDYNYCA